MKTSLELAAIEQRCALDLALLLQAGNLLSSSLEPQVIMDRLTQLLAKAAGADLVSLFIFEGTQARRISVYGPWLAKDLLAYYPVGETVDWRAYETTRQLRESGRATTGPVTGPNFPPSVQQALVQNGLATFAAIPLTYQSEIIGGVYVYASDASQRVDRATMTLLQGLADHAAVALEQARMHQTLKNHAVALENQVAKQTVRLTQRNRELMVLNQVLMAANQSSKLDETLTTIAGQLHNLLEFQECSLYVLSNGGAPMTIATSVVGELPAMLSPHQLAPDSDLWQELEANDGVLYCTTAELPFERLEGASLVADQIVLCSLRAQNQRLGLAVMRYRQHECMPQSDDFWRSLGDQIGLALQNTRLRQSAEEQTARLRILLDIGRDLNSSLDLNQVLDKAVIAIRDYVADVHNCAISLLEDEGRVLHSVSQWHSLEPHQIRPLGTKVAVRNLRDSRKALETQQPVMSVDFWDDPTLRESERTFVKQTGLRALLYAPILGREGPMGLIHINAFHRPRLFEPHEIELVQGIAAQLALALENARLMETAQAHAAAAQARAQELDAFTFTVSHDLKSPLTNLQGFAEMIVEDYGPQLDDQGRQYLQRISANTKTMAQMIDELLLLSRVDRDERPPEPVDIGHVVENVLYQFEPVIKKRGVQVVIQPDLPTLLGQEVWLEQVFANLVGNAIKFIDDEQPEPRVEIGWRVRDGQVELWVSDNGIGIAPDDRERIFGLFTRLHTVRREGTGLGLAIVRRVIQRAGGQIWVESQPERGSRFCFTWPSPV